MKENEVMLGDWVQFGGTIRQIQTLEYDGEGKCWFYSELDQSWCSLEQHKPIPLTPEILKKNGFMEKHDGLWPRYVFVDDIDKSPQTVIDFVFYDEGVLADTLFECWTKSKGRDGENNIHICDLKFVHEMQHALRLAGIEKDIVL